LITVARYGPERTDTDVIVNLKSGEVRHNIDAMSPRSSSNGITGFRCSQAYPRHRTAAIMTTSINPTPASSTAIEINATSHQLVLRLTRED
jgi:hypothetical protein